jgi:chaperonin GroEL
VQEILPVLELAAREARPLVFIAEEVEGQALAAMIMNAVRGSMKVAAVKAPGYGQERRGTLRDICVSTGATFFTRESAKNMKEVSLLDFGQAKKIEILKNQTTIVGGHGDPDEVDKVIEALRQEIKQTDDMRECEMLQSRVTRLNSGVVEILVGGATEVEMIEKKHRIEDALEAVKSALEEGIVPGGGSALLRCKDLNLDDFEDDQLVGAKILLKSLESPARQMAKNAGESEDLIINKILLSDDNYGWNFAQGKLVNMLEEGIIDPAKVTRVALENAVSAASTLLTSGHAIVEK